ncbi:MAG: hypothetical protein ACON4O_02375 [Lentimonas sp.]
MKIQNIRIQNVRGLADYTIEGVICKNRPHILVAQNGFGKTSIATAFKSAAEQTMIKLKSDEDRYNHLPSNKAKISLEYGDKNGWRTLSVSEAAHSNDIRKEFDLIVISDLTDIKASSQNFGNVQTKAKGKAVIPPIDAATALKKPSNPYSIRSLKAEFESDDRRLSNLDKTLFSRPQFKERAEELWKPISRLKRARAWAKFDCIRSEIQSFSGGDSSLRATINQSVSDLAAEDNDFATALKLVNETTHHDNFDAYLSLWQLVVLARSKESELKKYLEWLHYDAFKRALKEGTEHLSKAWKKPSVNESKGRLVIQVPEPKHISNGQRDVLTLFALFQKAKYSIKKQRAILIIDEVFDYLDDANLTVAQYYVTQLIQKYKDAGKELYPIILTHLNPAFFKNYAFSDQKVIYLGPKTAEAPVVAMQKLIASRELKAPAKQTANQSDDLQKKISKYLVHYHATEIDFSADLAGIKGCRSTWGKPGKFQEFLEEEFLKYKEGSKSDPLAICAITRRSIEKQAYDQIAHLPDASVFFETHGTAPKLDWTRKRGAKIPEFHYLLRIIFDDGLHWNEHKSLAPIIAKLHNPVIRDLVIRAVEPSPLSAAGKQEKPLKESV